MLFELIDCGIGLRKLCQKGLLKIVDVIDLVADLGVQAAQRYRELLFFVFDGARYWIFKILNGRIGGLNETRCGTP